MCHITPPCFSHGFILASLYAPSYICSTCSPHLFLLLLYVSKLYLPLLFSCPSCTYYFLLSIHSTSLPSFLFQFSSSTSLLPILTLIPPLPLLFVHLSFLHLFTLFPCILFSTDCSIPHSFTFSCLVYLPFSHSVILFTVKLLFHFREREECLCG